MCAFTASLDVPLTKVPTGLDDLELVFDFVDHRLQIVPLNECQCDSNLRWTQLVFVILQLPSSNIDERHLVLDRDVPIADDVTSVVGRFHRDCTFDGRVDVRYLLAELHPSYCAEHGMLHYVRLVANGDLFLAVDVNVSSQSEAQRMLHLDRRLLLLHISIGGNNYSFGNVGALASDYARDMMASTN